MSKFFDLFTHDLAYDACSGDEADGNDYYFTTLEWRAEPVREFMDTLDNLHLAKRLKGGPFGDTGNFPVNHKKPAETIFDKRTAAPKGLPRNFYDADWLQLLEEHEVAALEMKDDLDLTIPEGLKQ